MIAWWGSRGHRFGLAINGLLMKVGLDFSSLSGVTSYMG